MRRIEPLAFTWTASSDGLAMRIGPRVLMQRGSQVPLCATSTSTSCRARVPRVGSAIHAVTNEASESQKSRCRLAQNRAIDAVNGAHEMMIAAVNSDEREAQHIRET